MKIDWKFAITRMLIINGIIIINHLTNHFINLGYEDIVMALLRGYFVATAGIFLGLWDSKYNKRKNKESKDKNLC